MDKFQVDPRDTSFYNNERQEIRDLYADDQITDDQFDKYMKEIDDEEFGVNE